MQHEDFTERTHEQKKLTDIHCEEEKRSDRFHHFNTSHCKCKQPCNAFW